MTEVLELKTQDLSPDCVNKFHGARYLIQEVKISQFAGDILLVRENEEIAQYWASGYVRKVGDGYENGKYYDMRFVEGELVWYERLVGREIQLSGKKYRVVPQSSVFGNFEVLG